MIKFSKWNPDHVHAFMAFAGEIERQSVRRARRVSAARHMQSFVFVPDWFDPDAKDFPMTIGVLELVCKTGNIELPPYVWTAKAVSYNPRGIPDHDTLIVLQEGAL